MHIRTLTFWWEHSISKFVKFKCKLLKLYNLKKIKIIITIIINLKIATHGVLKYNCQNTVNFS